MSTYIYLECIDHDPPLPAEGESGQHLYDLPQLRTDVANREPLVNAASEGMSTDDYFRRNTLSFLVRHPKCRLRIVDEYGTEHPLEDAK